MKVNLKVPSAFVGDLRSGLFCEFGFVSEMLSTLALTTGSRGPKEVYDRALRGLEAARTYLDVTGWVNRAVDSDVEIDLGLDSEMVLRALRNQHVGHIERLGEIEGTYVPASTREVLQVHAEGLLEFIESVEMLVVGQPRDDAGTDELRAAPKQGRCEA